MMGPAPWVSGPAFQSRGMSTQGEIASDSPMQTIEPEYFVFAEGSAEDCLRDFVSTAKRWTPRCRAPPGV